MSYPLLGKIKQGKGRLFAGTFLCWIFWNLFNRIIPNITGNAGAATIANVFRDSVSLLICWTIMGIVFEGGFIRAVYISLIQDILISLVTFVTEILSCGILRIPYSTMRADTHLPYHPLITLAHFVIFTGLMLLFRTPLRRFRETPIEQYPVVRFVGYAAVSSTMILAYMVGAPGYASNRPEDLALCFVFLLICFLLAFYHIRTKNIEQHNFVLAQQNQLMKEHMAVSQGQVALTRKLRHDIRRHLNVLEWSDSEGKSQEVKSRLDTYRNELNALYRQLNSGVYTGKTNIDGMLHTLERYCRKREYDFTAQLKQVDFAEFSEAEQLELMFYVVYWAMQCCEENSAGKSSAVSISGGSAAGASRLVIQVTMETEQEAASPDKADDRVRKKKARTAVGSNGTKPVVKPGALRQDICQHIQTLLSHGGTIAEKLQDNTAVLELKWN